MFSRQFAASLACYGFSALLIVYVADGARKTKQNICPSVVGCSCLHTTSDDGTAGLSARCKGFDPDFHLLFLPNVTVLQLNNCEFSNESIFWDLRRADLSVKFFLRSTPISKFNWNWLPNTASAVFLGYFSTPLSLVSENKTTVESNTTCLFRNNININKVDLYSIPYKNPPSCLPPKTTSLSLVNVPLTGFNKPDGLENTPAAFKWPPKLRILYIKRAKMSSIGDHVFREAPATVDKLVIGTCDNALGRLSKNWPRGVRLLWVMNCGVNEVKSEDLKTFTHIENLNLRGNLLVTLPNVFPASIKQIDVVQNDITHVHNVLWDLLLNLTVIDLSMNKLVSVPTNLPPNLVHLNLRNNEIDYCDRNAFTHMKKLKFLDLAQNKLINMPENLPTTLQTLWLQNNNLALVRTPASYEFCVNCISVKLSDNPWVCDTNLINMVLWFSKQNIRIFSLHGPCASTKSSLNNDELYDLVAYMSYMRKSFGNCVYNVKRLECNSTDITSLPSNLPQGLETVVVNNNALLTTIAPGVLKNQERLEKVYMSNNTLAHFPQGLSGSLKELHLSDNKITGFSDKDQETLDILVNLKLLDLSRNLIKTVYDYQLLPLTMLADFMLVGNPLHCDCSLQSLTYWYAHRKRYEYFFAIPHCSSPPDRKGQIIIQLTGAFEYEYQCAPSTCSWTIGKGVLNCSKTYQENVRNFDNATFKTGVMPTIPPNTYWKSLDLSDLLLKSEQVSIKQLTRLETVNLTGNLIDKIPFGQFSSGIKQLILQGNKITHLPKFEEINAKLPKLELLDLTYNQIASIDQTEVKIFPLVNAILLHGNPLLCDCKMRPLVTWIQTNEDQNDIDMHHFKNLTCAKPSQLNKVKLDELKEEEYCSTAPNTALVVGLVAGIITVLIGASIVNFVLHKHRKKQERRDIVQGFKDLLEREALVNDDPETGIREEPMYKYDAFVSYCCGGADEDFVFDMLEELEENQGRSICVHERDFLPGRGIADNIVQCIVASRKVILVISRKYASSSWCQYEVQVALAQLHERRRGRLLVPVLLEDVTRDEAYAGSVKTILSAITGLHVPKDGEPARAWKEFWKKLGGAIK